MDDVVNPPRPRMVIQVGITAGHRFNQRTEVDPATLQREVEVVLEMIRETAEVIQKASPWAYDSAPPLLRLLTPLAEGVDRITTHAALALGYSVFAFLPFPEDEYEKDFSPAGRKEFSELIGQCQGTLVLDGQRATDAQAYRRVDEMVVAHSDLLLTLWDGNDNPGMRCNEEQANMGLGTIPVVYLLSPPPLEPQMSLSREPDGSRVKQPSLQRWDPGKLKENLILDLSPPTKNDNEHLCLQNYFQERRYPRLARVLHVFHPFRKRSLGKPASVDLPCSWSSGQAKDASAPLPMPIPDSLEKHRDFANDVAVHYASLYRLGFVLLYVMSGLAVLFAVVDIALGGREIHGGVIEFVLILVIIMLTFVGRRFLWHRRWMAYRELSERARHGRFLYPLGRKVPLLQPPPQYGNHDSRFGWVLWLLRALERESGPPVMRMTPESLIEIRNQLVEDEVGGQIQYHAKNAHFMGHLDHNLHRIGQTLFVLTLLACVAHALLGGNDPYDLSTYWANWLTVLSAFLPAMGATIQGIRTQGEFERIAERSESMTQTLCTLMNRLTELSPAQLNSESLGELADETAIIMSSEVMDWRIIFLPKEMRLPS